RNAEGCGAGHGEGWRRRHPAELRPAGRHLRRDEAARTGDETPRWHLRAYRPLRSARVAFHGRVSTEQVHGRIGPMEENGRNHSGRVLRNYAGAHPPAQRPPLSEKAEERLRSCPSTDFVSRLRPCPTQTAYSKSLLGSIVFGRLHARAREAHQVLEP